MSRSRIFPDSVIPRSRRRWRIIEHLRPGRSWPLPCNSEQAAPRSEQEIDRARRPPYPELTVLFIDVNGLKVTNDTHGHSSGDALLVGVVDVLRKRLRSYDLILRYGGDEFVCELAGVGKEAADRLVESIKSQVTEHTGGSVTVGVAVLQDGDDAASLMKRADADMYAQRELVGRRQRPRRAAL